MTPAQCRGARELLDWTQIKLAEASRIAVATVMSPDTIRPMKRTVEAAGVEFFAENNSGAGVKFRKGN